MKLNEQIVKFRKERQLTQEQLANFIGVSKASISKWETGQNFPDITYLPALATFFDVTIDELVGYESKCPVEQVPLIYKKLANDFVTKPFEDVLGELNSWIKRYYHDTHFILQMGILLLNHYGLAATLEKQQAILQEMILLYRRVQGESKKVVEIKQAQHLQALCAVMLQDADQAIALLQEEITPMLNSNGILISAYQLKGDTQKAKETAQISIYQYILGLSELLLNYLQLVVKDQEKFVTTIKRLDDLIASFQLIHLHPNVVAQIYYSAATGYMERGEIEEALVRLEKYVAVSTNELFPVSLHGDDFFDQIEAWLKELNGGVTAPRDEQTIRQSVLESLTLQPLFIPLAENTAFQGMIQTIKDTLGVA